MKRTVVVLSAFALVLAACSSDGGSDVASLEEVTADVSAAVDDASSETIDEELILEFSQCMRDNGIEDFEDPEIGADGSVEFRLGGATQDPQADRETMRAAFNDAPQNKPFVDRLLFVVRRIFKFFGQNQQLSQDLLRELTFYTTGMHSARFLEHRVQSIERFKGMVDDAKEAGEVSTRHDSATVAQCIFYLQAAEVRRWLGGDAPSLENGIRKFKELLNVLMTGLSPR